MDTEQLIASFDTHYFPHLNSDGVSNAHALCHVFNDAPLATTWLFTLHLGLGVQSMQSLLFLTPIFYMNNPDIPL